MPRCAMPEHLNDKEEIENAFPDDSQYSGWFGKIYRWYQKKTKTWFCFSYRCKGWLKWRKFPIVLFAVGGKGKWRYESEIGDVLRDNTIEFFNSGSTPYLSRIQYYKRWHFSIQWPLIITFHWYSKEKDVPIPGQPRPDSDGKLWFGYWNHYDADNIYWMITSVFLGRAWK